MAFETLPAIVITAIPKPRSREKVPQDCRNHPKSPKTRFEDTMLIPCGLQQSEENENRCAVGNGWAAC